MPCQTPAGDRRPHPLPHRPMSISHLFYQVPVLQASLESASLRRLCPAVPGPPARLVVSGVFYYLLHLDSLPVTPIRSRPCPPPTAARVTSPFESFLWHPTFGLKTLTLDAAPESAWSNPSAPPGRTTAAPPLPRPRPSVPRFTAPFPTPGPSHGPALSPEPPCHPHSSFSPSFLG